jgi:prepilin-type N-terminal cleavage/methylation domain-containing protein
MIRRCASDNGFTLIEVLVAIMILAVTAAGAVGLMTTAALSNQVARGQSLTAVLAAAKLEQLRGLAWGFGPSGAPVSDMTTDLCTEPAGRLGVGLSPSPADALARNVPGFVDFVDATGRWVGTGSGAPSQAVYIRRWSVQPLSSDPANTLVFQVLATSAARRPGSGTDRLVRLPGDVVLTTIKTRKAA